MKVTPLSKALGAEITELDLRKPLDDAAVKAIRDAFDQHIFVVFREQELSEDDQLRAAGYFGKVHIRRKPVTDPRSGRGSSTRRSCWSPTSSRTASPLACSATARCGSTTTPATTRSRTGRPCSIR